MSNPDFAMFDTAYCHHWLVLRQKEGLLDMQRQIDKQLEELETQDQVQRNNVELLIPNLKTKGFTLCITETLGQPDIVGETPFSYPISQWNPPNRNPPTTPTLSPNPVIPKLKKKHKFGEECPKCMCKYLYDHVAWARGLDSGYTCQCPEEPSPTNASSSRQPASDPYLSLHHKPCRLCGMNPPHTREYCLEYKCPHCHLYAPEHMPQTCKHAPHKPKHLGKVKEEPQSPTPFNWDHKGYYEIEGYDDGNLNREN